MFFLIGVKILILAGLIKLLLETEKPNLCAGIYSICAFLGNLAFERGLLPSFGLAFISFGFAYLYFWLLNRFSESGATFFFIIIMGLLIGVV